MNQQLLYRVRPEARPLLALAEKGPSGVVRPCEALARRKQEELAELRAALSRVPRDPVAVAEEAGDVHYYDVLQQANECIAPLRSPTEPLAEVGIVEEVMHTILWAYDTLFPGPLWHSLLLGDTILPRVAKAKYRLRFEEYKGDKALSHPVELMAIRMMLADTNAEAIVAAGFMYCQRVTGEKDCQGREEMVKGVFAAGLKTLTSHDWDMWGQGVVTPAVDAMQAALRRYGKRARLMPPSAERRVVLDDVR